MSKKKASPASKKSPAKKKAVSAVTKQAAFKKSPGKAVAQKSTVAKKSTPKPVAKKVAGKAVKSAKAAPSKKKVSAKTSHKPVTKPATSSVKKPSVIKSSAKTKPAAKAVKKSAAKPVPAKKPAAKKAPTKPASASTKKAAQATPKAKPASGAQKKVPAVKNSAPAAKKSVKKAEVSGKTKKGTSPVKTPAIKRDDVETPSVPRADRVRPSISFSLEDIRDYLKQRQGAKINVYVPGDESGKPLSAAARKAAALAEEPKKKARQVGAVSVEDLLGFNPFKKEAANYDEAQIPSKWRKYYKLLVELRDKLQQGLSLHTEEALKKSGKEDSGDLSGYSQHMADAGTDSFDRDFALNLVSSEQEALYEIAEAIDRMRRGTYGVCEITGKPIPPDRLTAVPFTRYSLEGQRELERNRRIRRRGGMLGNPLTELGEGVTFGTGGDEAEEP